MAATNNHLLPLRTPQASTPKAPTTTTTPGSRRAISAEPTAITASGKRLSLSARRRIAVAPPSTTLTPHAKAAYRSLDQRRAAIFTPRAGRRRRSSLRDPRGAAGRETPRDVLRDLSRALAPTSTVIESSSSSSPAGGDGPRDAAAAARSRRHRGRKSAGGDTTLDPLEEFEEEDDDDDEFPIERPRFSLPMMEDDDLDDLKPPRLSGLEEDNYTATSIELPRRAWSEGPLARFDRDRGSLAGSVRFSDYNGPELMSDAPDIDSGFFPPPALDDDDDDGDAVLDEQAMVERFEDARRQTVGGESDFGPIEIPDAGNDTTFLMAPVESPTRDQTTVLEEDFDDDDDVGGPAIMDDYDDDGDDNDNNNDINNDHSINPADDSAAGLTGLIDGGDDIGLDETTMLSHTADLTNRLLRPASASGEDRTHNNSRRKKAATGKKISKHGIEYKSLPQGVIKRLATTFARTAGSAKLNPDALAAVTQATDWFFEQLADDLQAYAQHAGRKTIDESDMVTLMRRQRQTSASTTPFALAQRHLPRELLQELRMPAPPPTKAPRKKAGRRVEVEDEEDAT